MSPTASAPCSATLELAIELMKRVSVTPDDAGCNELLADRLRQCGFTVEAMPFGRVDNFWARLGSTGPLLTFAGHTDVVPAGPLEEWRSPPFEPTIDAGILYGRGAADMKGSIAAMITACERLLSDLRNTGQELTGSIAFLITSDEEGVAIDGTRKVVEVLESRDEKINFCIVGEPSSNERCGDVIKIGRRGSLHGRFVCRGVQGHVAYPHLASNPIHRAMAPLAALCEEAWDNGNEAFPPTSFQVSNIRAGTGADNVIPGTLEASFNFRFSTELTQEQISRRTEKILNSFGLDYTLDWELSGLPFLTEEGDLLNAAVASVADVNGIVSQTSTSGGTSDGRFIAPTGAQLVELGPCNATIHQVNENVRASELDELSLIYEGILRRLLLR